MKIIQVAAIATTVEAFLLPLIEKLSQKGHELIIITSDDTENLKQNEYIQKKQKTSSNKPSKQTDLKKTSSSQDTEKTPPNS